MALQILSAASISANYHIYINRSDIQANSVATGLTNPSTFNIPVQTRDARLTIVGTFGSGSASTQVIVGVGDQSGGRFMPILTVSVPMTTVIPIFADTTLILRHQWTSAAAAITNASVDAWLA